MTDQHVDQEGCYNMPPPVLPTVLCKEESTAGFQLI